MGLGDVINVLALVFHAIVEDLIRSIECFPVQCDAGSGFDQFLAILIMSVLCAIHMFFVSAARTFLAAVAHVGGFEEILT